MTLHQFERNFELELEEAWEEARGDFFNWNSFVYRAWKEFNDDEY